MDNNGLAVVQVLYNYESRTARGHSVLVQPGERYVLISDTNDQWWYVAKEGLLDDGFYLPKSYVIRTALEDAVSTFRASTDASEQRAQRTISQLVHSEQFRTSPAEPKLPRNVDGSGSSSRPGFWLAPAGSRISRSIPVDLHLPPALEGLSLADDSSRENTDIDTTQRDSDMSPPITPIGAKPSVVPRGSVRVSNSARQASMREHSRAELDNFGPPVSVSPEQNKRHSVTNGTFDDPTTYENVQCISARRRPPGPRDGEIPLRRLPHDWAEYFDPHSGRTYFFHCTSGTATWKPPRRMVPPRDSSNALGELTGDDAESSFSADEPGSRASMASGMASPAPVSSACVNNVDEDSVRQLNDVSDTELNGEQGTPPPPTTPPSLQYLYNSAKRPTTNSESEQVEHDTSAADTTALPLDSSTASSTGAQPVMTASLDSGIGGLRQGGGTSLSLRNKSYGSKWPQIEKRASAFDPYACSQHVANFVCSSTAAGGRDASPNGRLQRGGFHSSSVSTCYQKAAKSGAMEKCKLAEAGKKIKRVWTPCYVYLTGAHLIFYKDEKSAEKRGQHYPLPLGVCDLRGALLAWAERERDRRHKHVFQLRLVDGTVYAFSASHTQDVNSWYHAVRQVIAKLPEPDKYPTPVIEAPASALAMAAGSNGRRSLIVSRNTAASNTSTGGGSLRGKADSKSSSRIMLRQNGEEPSSSILDGSTKESRDTILEKLRRFFRTRPSLESLKQKGIYKPEPVFGGVLMEICRREQSTVPKFLRIATGVIELRGLDVDGIYRMSGNLSQVQKIRCQCDQDKYGLLRGETDIHVVTGALKLFFRELHDPLFPLSMTKDFISAIKLQRPRDRVRAFTDLIARMPTAHRDTLQHLLRHLLTVAEHSSKNRMEIYNLAIVFGPTVFSSDGGGRAPIAGPAAAGRTAAKGKTKGAAPPASKAVQPNTNPTLAFNMIMQGQAVEYLLKEYSRFFPDPQPAQPDFEVS